MWLIPWVVMALLIVVGIAMFSDRFLILYYLMGAMIGLPLAWYGMKLVLPKCRICGGKGKEPASQTQP